MPLININTGRTFSDEMGDSMKKFERLIDNGLPDHIVVVAQKLVDDSFRQEQYQDRKSSKWSDRKNDDEAGEARTNRRAILVQSGKLIGSVEAERRGKDIVIGTDTEYAQVHNEGLNAGRNRSVKMPKRQFMPIPGEASPIDAEVEKWMDNEMNKIFG